MQPSNQGTKISAGHDRFERVRKVFGVMAFTVKVSATDTNNNCLIIEQANDYRGGPPRHIHFDQEEWFYVVKGEYTVEISGKRYLLKAGDCILAPRNVSHTWALTGVESGTMIISFHPAGDMEAFFDEATQLQSMPSHPDLKQLFKSHGMEITGPPLEVA